MDSTSCDSTLLPDPRTEVTAVKVVVLGESEAALRAVLEPLSDDPVRTVEIGRDVDSADGHPASTQVLLTRLTLEPGLLLFLFGATRPTPPEVLRELLPRAAGTVFVGSGPEAGEAHRLTLAGQGGAPWIVSPVPGEGPARPSCPGLSNTTVPHRATGPIGRQQAKQPIAAVLRKAVAARRAAPSYRRIRHR